MPVVTKWEETSRRVSSLCLSFPLNEAHEWFGVYPVGNGNGSRLLVVGLYENPRFVVLLVVDRGYGGSSLDWEVSGCVRRT